MTALTLRRCPVCQQDVRIWLLSGREIFASHLRPGSAPPCAGSNRTVREAEAEQRKGAAAATLFDDQADA